MHSALTDLAEHIGPLPAELLTELIARADASTLYTLVGRPEVTATHVRAVIDRALHATDGRPPPSGYSDQWTRVIPRALAATGTSDELIGLVTELHRREWNECPLVPDVVFELSPAQIRCVVAAAPFDVVATFARRAPMPAPERRDAILRAITLHTAEPADEDSARWLRALFEIRQAIAFLRGLSPRDGQSVVVALTSDQYLDTDFITREDLTLAEFEHAVRLTLLHELDHYPDHPDLNWLEGVIHTLAPRMPEHLAEAVAAHPAATNEIRSILHKHRRARALHAQCGESGRNQWLTAVAATGGDWGTALDLLVALPDGAPAVAAAHHLAAVLA